MLLSISSCRQKQKDETTPVNQRSSDHIQRFRMVTGLKRKKIEYYKKFTCGCLACRSKENYGI